MAIKVCPPRSSGIIRAIKSKAADSDRLNNPEFIKCRDDAAYFINNYCIIDDTQEIGGQSGVMPFRLWDDQLTTLRTIENKRKIVILKARQLGISWLVCAYVLWFLMFHSGKLALMFSKTEDDAKELIRRISVMYQRLPVWMHECCPLAKNPNVMSIWFKNGSRAKADAATATAGSGETASILVLDELAKIANARPLYTASAATVANGTTKLIALSSAFGTGNLFHDIWSDAFAGRNDFEPIFLPWWSRPGRDQAWYDEQVRNSPDPDEIKQEYPSCFIGNTNVSSNNGIFAFSDNPEYCKGEAPVVKVTTSLGYQVICTPNHHFKTESENWISPEDFTPKQRIKLLPPTFSKEYQKVRVNLGLPILSCGVDIDEDFAEFLGMYMGDGSIHKNKTGSGWTLSMVFNRIDQDSIEKMKSRMIRLFGSVTERVSGEKKGCIELRTSSKYLGELFDSLELYRKSENGSVRRNIHVPKYIFSSPKSVVAAFLRGLFDADGFIGYEIPKVSFFSKHEKFARDVQLLLLGFGITSKYSIDNKKSGDGHLYTGRSLTLRKYETIQYMKEIGFISSRKNQRWSDQKDSVKKHGNDIYHGLSDFVVSVEDCGIAPVYDMEVLPEHYYSANGLFAHNSPIEAFLVSGNVRFNAAWIELQFRHLRKTGLSIQDSDFFRDMDGLTVYHYPDKTRRVGIGADVAEGRENGDFSHAVVVDLDTLEELACLHGKWEGDEFAEKIDALSRAYRSWAVVERNNHGFGVLSKLRSLGNRAIAHGLDDREGWLTNSVTKPLSIDWVAICLRDDRIKIHSPGTLDEMQQYRKLGNGKTGAPEGRHDDRVMAWAVLLGWRFLVEPTAEAHPIDNPMFDQRYGVAS